MSAKVKGDGPRTWSGAVDEEGQRTYKAQFLVVSDDTKDGPDQVLKATGLPKVGDTWNFGNDSNGTVYCTPQADAQPYRSKVQDPGFYWTVDKVFSSKFTFIGSRPRISISGSRYTKEIVRDRFGKLVVSTSHELFRGPQVEFDFNRGVVKIEITLRDADLPLWTRLIDNVNSNIMWGCPVRSVKMEPPNIDEKDRKSVV